ncbi:transcription initiation factor TFIID subunit 1-like, partial [Meriones unguiculatus]|uniref:transcription initiation factor TFIID subunit 1-like n=1 Tax=Meriones unguiculatus TaxID=10047 RepID=UPI00293E3455
DRTPEVRLFPRRRPHRHSLQAARTETLENDSEESAPAYGGRRYCHPRAQETEDRGLRASHRACAACSPRGYLGVGFRERVGEVQVSGRHHSRERKLEGSFLDGRSRVSSGRVGDEGGCSRSDSRRAGENRGRHRSVSQERIRGRDGHRLSSPWVAVRGDSDHRSSDASPGEVSGSHSRASRGAVSEDAWVGVSETRGPQTSHSSDRGSDDRSGSWGGASTDGSHCATSSWEDVDGSLDYEASDSSRASIAEESSSRHGGFWERESEEDSRLRDSWDKREDRGPRASDEESSCCSSRDSCEGESEARCSSRGLGSTPPQSPSPREKDHTMPGPSKSSRESADSSFDP